MSPRGGGRGPMTLPMWERVKSGEWQYGKGLALAWSGECTRAAAEFRSAHEKFRVHGDAEMARRVSLHLEMLECRCEPDSEGRRERVAHLMMRLSTQTQIEGYRPPFGLLSGSRVSDQFWHDLERPEFVLAEALSELLAEDGAVG